MEEKLCLEKDRREEGPKEMGVSQDEVKVKAH